MMLRGFTYKSPLRTFILLCLPLVFWTLGEGRVIGSSKTITAVPGQDVIVPCQLDAPINGQTLVVEWLKLSLETSVSGDTVYLYRNGKEEVREKIQSYVSRTQMFTDELEHGDMSLKILNVTSADTGRYRCFIPKTEEYADVQLVVETSLPPTNVRTSHSRNETDDKEVNQTGHSVWIVPVVFIFFLVLIVIVIGYLIKRQRQKQTQSKIPDVKYHIISTVDRDDIVEEKTQAEKEITSTPVVIHFFSGRSLCPLRNNVDGDESLAHFTVLDLSNQSVDSNLRFLQPQVNPLHQQEETS